MNNPILFSLAGPPGCGKGTFIKYVLRPYCERIGRPLVIFPISTEIQVLLDTHSDPAVAHSVRTQIKEGYLVPDKIANDALMRALQNYLQEPKENAVFVTDGSPRTEEQTETALITLPQKLDIEKGQNIFVRFTTRPYLCGYRACHRSREDDNEEAFKTRWAQFESKTIPALKLITDNPGDLGVTVKEINGAAIRQSPELFVRLAFGDSFQHV